MRGAADQVPGAESDLRLGSSGQTPASLGGVVPAGPPWMVPAATMSFPTLISQWSTHSPIRRLNRLLLAADFAC